MRKDWEIKRLGEVCDFQNGFAFKSNTFKESGIPVVRITNIQHEKVDASNIVFIDPSDYKQDLTRYKVKKGDLLIAMSGATTGKIGIHVSDEELLLNQRVGRFEPYSILNKSFLFNFLSTKVEESLAISVGAAQPNLSTEQIKNFQIPIPPLPEQKRIVSILDKAFAAIDKAKANAEQNLNNSKELFNNSVNSLFENNNGWIKSKLGEQATFRNGMNFSRSSKGETIKIVGVKDFQNNYWVPFESLETVNLDNNLKDIDALNKNDIIAVRSNGNPELIGRTLLAGDFKGKVSHSGFTIRIRLNNEELLPTYVCHYLKSQKARRSLIDSGNGVGIKSLNQGSLSNLSIAFPQSNREQEKIVSTIDELQNETKKLNEIYCRKLDDMDELKKSILHKAFNGEL